MRSPWGAWLPALVALVVMVTRVLFGAATRLVYEDAFITFRYARNLAEGQGFVFNAGERVLGTTAPLLALVLAPLGGFADGGWLQPAAVALGIASTGALVLLWFRLCRRLELPDAVPLVAAALLTVSLELTEAGLSGMETLPVLALMFAGLALLVEGREVAGGVALGLLLICRVDAAPWAGLVLGYAWWARRRAPLRALGALAAAVAPWLIFATLYFGSPIPHTLAAKQAAYQPLGALARLRELWAMVRPFERHVPLLPWVLDAAFVAGAVAAARRARALLVPVAGCLVLVLALALVAHQTAPWHVVPASGAFALVAAVGIVVAVQWALAATGAQRALRLAVPGGLAIVALVSAGLRTIGAVDVLRRYAENDRAVPGAAGDWLRLHSDPAATVLAEPIGVLGFRSRRYLWDSVGLVSPRITALRRRFPEGNRWYLEALRELRPDFVVLRDFERPRNRMFDRGGPLLPVEELAWFDANYRPEVTFHPVHPGVPALTLYVATFPGSRERAEKASKN